MIPFMIEHAGKQHLSDHTKVARFVAEMRKLGVTEKDIYGYAVRLFVVDLDVLSSVLRPERYDHSSQQAPRSWWQWSIGCKRGFARSLSKG